MVKMKIFPIELATFISSEDIEVNYLKNNYLIFIFFKLILIFFAHNSLALSGYEINKKLKAWLLTKDIISNPTFSKNKIYKSCKKDIEFEKVFKDFSLVKVFCPDLEGWKIYLKSNAVKTDKKHSDKSHKNNKIIRLKYSHEKGDVITANSLEIDFHKYNNSFFSNPRELFGRKLKQNLKKGQIIKPRHLYKKFEINEGDPVIITSNIGSILVSSAGIAKKSGNLGDLLEVQNLRSGKIIKGYLKKNKIIQVNR